MIEILSRIDRNERGATAVEYGLIAGLIALGLLTSLVGTRTSLSNAFGTAATQMGTSTGATQNGGLAVTPAPQRAVTAASTSSRAPLWNGKTLAGKAVSYGSDGMSKTTTFTYTDGAKGVYTETYGADGKVVSEQTKVSNTYDTTDTLTFNYDANGNPTGLVWNDFYPNTSTIKVISVSNASGGWLETVTYYNTNGTVQSQNSSYTTSSTVLNNARGDETYFRALSQ
jgi:pilus assembly protein Flp/PilA